MSWIFCLKMATDGNSYKLSECLETKWQPNSVIRQTAIMGRTLLTPRKCNGGTFVPLGKKTFTILKEDGQRCQKH